MTAILHHRVAHELHGLGAPLVARIIAEIAHSLTGIDIHPAATIGARFFIDHGTGVVIGETARIGTNVRLYHGVTLGAKSFQVDDDGKLEKGAARHPIVEDDVVIYANATILGRITIGQIVETFSERRGIEILSCASTTFKRPDLDRAFEPDESYSIAHADQIRPKDEVDLQIDPPPDLVIEVEITSSAIAKLQLFAAMGVPEVWRHDGSRLEMLGLEGAGYRPLASSPSLPGLTAAMINAVLARRFEQGETALIKEFRGAIATD